VHEKTELVFLTNFIPPYRLPVFKVLASRLREFRLLVSISMEGNRSWRIDTSDLEVIQQHSICLRWRHRYHSGVTDEGYLHIPYDTIPWLLRLHPDVILTGEMGFRTLQALLYRKLLNRRSRVIVHADVSESTEFNRGELRSCLRRWVVHNADALIVNGASGKRYVCSLGNVENKIFIVPYTTDMTSFAATVGRNLPERSVQNIIYAGRLIECKGLTAFSKVLVRWARDHPERLIRWTLVGEGPLQGSLKELERPSNLRLRIVGWVPYEQMPALYAQEDILVLPTFSIAKPLRS